LQQRKNQKAQAAGTRQIEIASRREPDPKYFAIPTDYELLVEIPPWSAAEDAAGYAPSASAKKISRWLICPE